MGPVEPRRSPAEGMGCPLWEIRASMVTRPALDRLRPGIIDCESSSLNLSGQSPTVPRNTATGAPGESTDLATMNSVAPAAALERKAGASETSPLTAAPAGATVLGGAAMPAAAALASGTAAGALESSGSGGSCRARALLASSARPKNSNDLASNSQSSALPPPLASRASSEAMAAFIDPALEGGAEPALAAVPAEAVELALFDIITASLNPLDAAIPADPASGLACPSQRCRPTTASSMTPAPTAACPKFFGSAARRGFLRSHGNSMITQASVINMPARNQKIANVIAP